MPATFTTSWKYSSRSSSNCKAISNLAMKPGMGHKSSSFPVCVHYREVPPSATSDSPHIVLSSSVSAFPPNVVVILSLCISLCKGPISSHGLTACTCHLGDKFKRSIYCMLQVWPDILEAYTKPSWWEIVDTSWLQATYTYFVKVSCNVRLP